MWWSWRYCTPRQICLMNRQQSDSVRLKSSAATLSNSSPPSRYSITRITSLGVSNALINLENVGQLYLTHWLSIYHLIHLMMCGLENFLRMAISSTTFSLCSFFLVLMCLAAYILFVFLSWTWNTTPNLPLPSSFFSSYCWRYISPPSSFSILACFFSSFITSEMFLWLKLMHPPVCGCNKCLRLL